MRVLKTGTRRPYTTRTRNYGARCTSELFASRSRVNSGLRGEQALAPSKSSTEYWARGRGEARRGAANDVNELARARRGRQGCRAEVSTGLSHQIVHTPTTERGLKHYNQVTMVTKIHLKHIYVGFVSNSYSKGINLFLLTLLISLSIGSLWNFVLVTHSETLNILNSFVENTSRITNCMLVANFLKLICTMNKNLKYWCHHSQ